MEENEDEDFEESPQKVATTPSSRRGRPRRAAQKRQREEEDDEEEVEDDFADEDDDDDAGGENEDGGGDDEDEMDDDDDEEEEEDDDDDADDDDDDEDAIEMPAAKRARTAKGKSPKRGSSAKKSPRASKKATETKRRSKPTSKGTSKRKQSKTPAVKRGKLKQLSALERIERAMKAYKWWEEPELPAGINWRTLEHAGISFPAPYEPHGVKMKYDGKEVSLTPEQEEVATFFAMIPQDGLQLGDEEVAPIFIRNFFHDFRQILGPDHVIQEFDKCDFDPLRAWVERNRELKKEKTKEQKLVEKQAKQEQQLKYGFALVDGHIEKVGNIQVEIPGLFRGRGKHPKTGTVKKRIMPEEITLNVGEDAAVPPCPIPGHQWGRIIHDPTVTWLAFWRENVMGATKYMYLAASSSFKGKSDRDKYEKARQLKHYIDRIREHYEREIVSDNEETRQCGTAMWVIDRLALRVGGEKEEDEADTVGCCSLRLEHLTFGPPKAEQLNKNEDDVDEEINTWLAQTGRDKGEADDEDRGPDQSSDYLITLDFLGKDSMRYFQTIDFNQYGEIGRRVYRNFRRFCHGKSGSDQVFDRLTPSLLNSVLQELMPGLTAKVFRTYNASITLERELQDLSENLSSQEKVIEYNRANREVAILCNHQRSLPRGFKDQFHKMIVRQKVLHDQLKELMSMERQLKKGKNKDRASIRLKDKSKPWHAKKAKELTDEEKQRRAEENHLFVNIPSLEQVRSRIDTYEQRLARHQLNMKNKDENKMVALTTSKINYMDPRISVAWCKRVECPVERIFSKTLCDKFPWAMDAPTTFSF